MDISLIIPALIAGLLLASTSATALQGSFLLTVFSIGLALLFLAIVLGIGKASEHIQNLTKYLNVVSVVGGVFLIFLGILLVTGNVALLIS